MPFAPAHRRALRLALVPFAALFAAQTAAQAEPSSRRVRMACSGDAQRLCPREKKDSPEIRYCMEAKGRQLSRGCVRALEDDGILPRGYFKS